MAVRTAPAAIRRGARRRRPRDGIAGGEYRRATWGRRLVLRQRIAHFLTRFVGFLRFDPAAYRAILDDPDGLIYAMIVVIVASALAAIGAAGPGFRPGAAVGAFFAVLAQWAVGVGLAYFLSITLFRQPKSMSFMGVMPLFGLTQAPR